jgi:hypothetical protein
MIPDDGPTYTNPLRDLDAEAKVEVGVSNLTDYAGHIYRISQNSMTSSARAFAHIPTLLSKGLTMPNDGVAPLAEGKMAQQMMAQRIADFQAFLSDMNNGIMAVANAAQVVAYCFDDTDGENGATIGQVAFAFADDGSHKPDGFDDRRLTEGGKTMEQLQEEAAARSGANLESYNALYAGSTDGATPLYTTPYGSSWKWPDGSRTTSSYTTETTTGQGGSTIITYVTTYTAYDKDGKVIGSRVVRSSTNDFDGSRTESTEISSGGTTQSNSTTTHADGSVTATSVGADGQPNTVEIGPAGGSDSGNEDMGPVEGAQERYDTDGTSQGQQQYGMAY